MTTSSPVGRSEYQTASGREHVESLRRLARALHLLTAFGFESVHMLIRHAVAKDPADPGYKDAYHGRLPRMWDAIKEAKGVCTLTTDEAMRGPAGTTPGQWVTTVRMHINDAGGALSTAYNFNPKGAVTSAVLEAHARGEGEGRIEWDDDRERVYSDAVTALRRELHRVHVWLEVLGFEGSPVGEVEVDRNEWGSRAVYFLLDKKTRPRRVGELVKWLQSQGYKGSRTTVYDLPNVMPALESLNLYKPRKKPVRYHTRGTKDKGSGKVEAVKDDEE